MFSSGDFSIAREKWIPAVPPAVMVLLVGLLLTCAAFVLVQGHERQHDRDLFNAEVAKFMGAVRQSFSASEVLMQSGAGMVAAHVDLAADEWRMFVDGDDLKARFPGFQGIAYLRLPAGPRDAAGQLPELELAVVEPEGAYTLAQLVGGAAGHAAMAQARDLNAPVRSRKVMLSGPGRDERAGVIVYVPVTRPDPGQRASSAVAGYVVMPFAAVDLIKGLMHHRFDDVKRHLRVEIFDGRVLEPAHLLFDSSSEGGAAASERSRVSAHLVVDRFGTDWTYRFSSLPAYDRALGSYLPASVLGGGVIVSGLVSWLCLQLTMRSRLAAEADRNSAVLKAELVHRVRNTLAVVQSLANRSLDSGASVDEGRDQFASRLGALARAHALLTENAWSGTSIGELMRSELAPMLNRAEAIGPEITLGPQVAQSLALVVHELASDAVRRGVTSIKVDWQAAMEAEPRAVVTWHERGAKQPFAQGFVQQIVENGFVMTSRDQLVEDTTRFSFAVPLH